MGAVCAKSKIKDQRFAIAANLFLLMRLNFRKRSEAKIISRINPDPERHRDIGIDDSQTQ